MHLSMSSWRGIGQGFDRSLWPGDRAYELSCCPGGRDIYLIFVCAHDTTNHFLGWGNSVIFDLTFLRKSRKFYRNFFLKMSNPSPMPCLPPKPPPPPPAGLTFIGALLKVSAKVLSKTGYCIKDPIFPGGGGGGRGAEGVLPEKLGGVCGPLPKTLTLFVTKLCDIPYPIYDLSKNSKPNL